jgi:hypothetical protein
MHQLPSRRTLLAGAPAIQGLAAVLAYWAEFNEDIWDGTDFAEEARWETLAEAAEALT